MVETKLVTAPMLVTAFRLGIRDGFWSQFKVRARHTNKVRVGASHARKCREMQKGKAGEEHYRSVLGASGCQSK
eukprot:6213734-Pleurochrysis_carterae.AAC.2